MSNRVFACVFILLAISLGWFWRIAIERDLPVMPFGVIAEVLLLVWLSRRLDRGGSA